jgi:hypothetical protein
MGEKEKGMKVEIKKRIEAIQRGEVPRGYKKTKIGIVPEDWEEGALQDVLRLKIRPVPKPDKPYWRLGLLSHAKGTFHELIENPETVKMDELYKLKKKTLLLISLLHGNTPLLLPEKKMKGCWFLTVFQLMFSKKKCPLNFLEQ